MREHREVKQEEQAIVSISGKRVDATHGKASIRSFQRLPIGAQLSRLCTQEGSWNIVKTRRTRAKKHPKRRCRTVRPLFVPKTTRLGHPEKSQRHTDLGSIFGQKSHLVEGLHSGYSKAEDAKLNGQWESHTPPQNLPDLIADAVMVLAVFEAPRDEVEGLRRNLVGGEANAVAVDGEGRESGVTYCGNGCDIMAPPSPLLLVPPGKTWVGGRRG